MSKANLLRASCLVLFCAALCSGCGSGESGVAAVEGTVTMDGKPLKDARVVFEPAGKGGERSEGVTDANGHYKLQYSADQAGAIVGEYVVRIRTSGMENGAKEVVPARYNAESELKKTVTAGSNNFDFPLKSGGKIDHIIDYGEEPK